MHSTVPQATGSALALPEGLRALEAVLARGAVDAELAERAAAWAAAGLRRGAADVSAGSTASHRSPSCLVDHYVEEMAGDEHGNGSR